MNFRKAALSGVKWTTFGTIGRALFQLIQISILTRFLSKEAFGLIAMTLLVVQFSNLFVDMGLSSSILHRQNATKNEYSSIYWLNIFTALLFYFILIMIAPLVAKFYNEPDLVILISIMGINLLLMAVGQQHKTIMQKEFQFKAISIIEFISFFFGLISAVILAIYDFGVFSLVYSTLFASFLSNFLFLIQNSKLNPIGFHFRFSETRSFLKIGGFTMGSTVFDFFSRETDVLIIGKLLGSENLGVYSLSKQIVLKIYSIINPVILNVLSPLLSSMQTEKYRLKISFLMIVKYLSYINVPIYLFIILLSKEILSIVYGYEYSEYYHILSFLAFAYCLTSLSNPVGSLQIATGRTDLGFKWTIFRVIITPIVIFLGALVNIEIIAAFYAFLSLILIVPLWFIQLKPMVEIKLLEYINQFYKPLIFFIIASLLFYLYDDKIKATNLVNFDSIFKVSLTYLCFFIYTYLVDKSILLQIFKVISVDNIKIE